MLDNLNSNFESSKAQRPDANDDEVEIDLLEIFYALKKKILLVLMVALAGGCIAAAYTQFLMTPIYSSTSSILVLSKETTLTSLADLHGIAGTGHNRDTIDQSCLHGSFFGDGTDDFTDCRWVRQKLLEIDSQYLCNFIGPFQ